MCVCARRTVALAKRNEKRMECRRVTTHRLLKQLKSGSVHSRRRMKTIECITTTRRSKTWFPTRGQFEFLDWFGLDVISRLLAVLQISVRDLYNSSFLLRSRTCCTQNRIRRSIARASSSCRVISIWQMHFAQCAATRLVNLTTYLKLRWSIERQTALVIVFARTKSFEKIWN